MKKSVFTILGVLGVLAVSPEAHATLMLPTLGAGPSGTTISGPYNTGQNNGGKPIGTLVASTGVESQTTTNGGDTASLTVSFEEEVYKELSGTLDFYYQIKVTAASKTGAGAIPAVQELDVSDFSNWTLEAGTAGSVTSLFGGAGTQSPTTIGRDSTPGDTVSFFFSPSDLKNGTTSLVLVVSTPATTYVPGDASLGNTRGVEGQDYIAFAPGVDPVPEPVSMLLGGSVLGLSALWLRRRRNAGKA